MTADEPATTKLKTIGFGHAEEREAHHFVVGIPRNKSGDVLIYEVFNEDLVGPGLDAANLRCKLHMDRWLKIADAFEDDFNRRLRAAGMKPGRWKQGMNPVARLLGKELTLLAWGIEDADPSLAYAAVQNWRGLSPEERWWLYTMTAAQSAHYTKRNLGWRKAVRYALTENPVGAFTSSTTTAERRARTKALKRMATDQQPLFPGLSDDEAVFAAQIWETK